MLEKWEADPLPKYTESPESPVSQPKLAEKYPYILNAGIRTPTFFHSANRQLPWLREIRPDPIVEIHPATAEKHGIREGDWVWIESPRGRAKEKAKLNNGIDPAVIVAKVVVVGRAEAPHAVRLSLGTPPDRRQVERGLVVLARPLARPPEVASAIV